LSGTERDLELEMRLRSRSFDAWALDYDRYRPTYPQELFDHIAARLQLPVEARVADLGAGTGKASRQMARRGWHVTALEPGEGMLEVLRSRSESEGLSIATRLASAEDTGLDDASVDLATAAQAFHWFDKPRAVEEMARVVRPGGGVAVFWNAPAEARSEFLTANAELMARYLPEGHVDRQTADDHEPPEGLSTSDQFDADDWVELAHERIISADDFVEAAFTASQVRLFVEDDAKERLRADLYELASQYFGSGSVNMPYDLSVYVARRR
jgi:ubiquinone/menaquinone biosynthesis C-methylase UbiE